MKKWERGVVFGVLLPPTAGREKSLKTRSHFSLCMGELRVVCVVVGGVGGVGGELRVCGYVCVGMCVWV